MAGIEDKCLDAFAGWLGTLGDDIVVLLRAAEALDAPPDARKALVGAINYVFKSLDLVPDGIDDIGYLDDAFVIRTGAALAVRHGLPAVQGDATAAIGGLAAAAETVREFLGPALYRRFESYVSNLRRGSARGRSAEDISSSAEVFAAFAADVRSFAKGYRPPDFAKDRRSLIKLKAFFEAKLPT